MLAILGLMLYNKTIMSAPAHPAKSFKISRTATFLLRTALVVAAILAVVTGRWSALFISLGTLGLTFVPQVLASRVNVKLPLQFEFAITAFLYTSMFLGEVGDYCEKFWWWDVVLHTGSAIAFGFAGFLLLYLMVNRNKLKASPFLISFFAFTFAVAIGALWELFEYFMDSTFGTNMLKSGLRDTMADLIVDTIGAATASVIGYIYLKFSVHDPFDALIGWFVQANPRFKHLQRLHKSHSRK